MNKAHTTALRAEGTSEEKVNVIDLLIVLARHKKPIIYLTLAAALISAAISAVLPNRYQGTVKLLPPQQSQSGAAALLSQLGGTAGAAVGMAGLKSPNELYIGMLRSRTVAERLVNSFKLKEVYDTTSTEKAIKELTDNTDISSGKDGIITLRVEDENQKMVAKLANSYVDELFKLTKVLALTEAAQRRMFFERQLVATKDQLANAEVALKRALDTRGVISVDTESRAVMEMVARLRAQASAKEVQLDSMRTFVTENNAEFKRVEAELSSLRAELAKLENGRPGADAASAAAGKGNERGLENIKLLRDIKYYQMLYELLAKQFEVARLDEAKDPAIVQVLDPAVEPERKSRPRRVLIVLLATAITFIASIAGAFVAEARRKSMRSPEDAARWKELEKNLRF